MNLARFITLTRQQLAEISDAAQGAYPTECCGLLVGHDSADGGRRVTRVVPSANLAATQRADRFEVDPKVQLGVMKDTRGGPDRLIGHYHSHPDHPPVPSQTDLTMALDNDLIWIIVAVDNGRPAQATAHQPNTDCSQFEAVQLLISDD